MNQCNLLSDSSNYMMDCHSIYLFFYSNSCTQEDKTCWLWCSLINNCIIHIEWNMYLVYLSNTYKTNDISISLICTLLESIIRCYNSPVSHQKALSYVILISFLRNIYFTTRESGFGLCSDECRHVTNNCKMPKSMTISSRGSKWLQTVDHQRNCTTVLVFTDNHHLP